jgi:lysozyme family protein
MIENYQASFDHVIKSEGGFTDDVRDSGNALPDGRQGSTNLGCTQRVWEAFVGHEVTHADMRALTPAAVAPLYKLQYWDRVKGDDLPSGLDYSVFDAAINSGPSQAAKWLQQVLDVQADGAIGPGTLAAVAAHSPADLINAYQFKRLAFLKNLKTWPIYGNGWGKRVAEVATLATEMTVTA